MTDCDEIYSILKSLDIEKVNLELKRSDVLRTEEGRKNLAKELVALANHSGGRLIIGLTDDGKFEGKKIFNVDDDKGIISNLIQDRISPIPIYNVDVLECNKGDLLIIRIDKKKDIPHAVVERKDKEIEKRVYYIKTPHDKRLVTDTQLKFLFTERDLTILYPFEICINFVLPDFEVPCFKIEHSIGIKEELLNFLDGTKTKIKTKLIVDSKNCFEFFKEIIPYLIIRSFARKLISIWSINYFTEDKSYGNSNLARKKLSINDLPDPPKDKIVSLMGIKTKKILRKHYFPDFFYVPPETSITFEFKEGSFPIIISNPCFKIVINLLSTHSSEGFDNRHPCSIYSKKSRSWDLSNKGIFHIRLNCEFSTEFFLPVAEHELFPEYFKFVKALEKILIEKWDYQLFLSKLPHQLHYDMKSNLDEIIDILNKRV